MNNMFDDDITKSIASAVKDVLEGKPAVIKEQEVAPVKKKEVKYPHMMYHHETGKSVKIMNKADHDKYTKMGWTHEKLGEVAEPQKPSGKLGQDSGEKDFADKHKGKKVGEKEDGTVVKESTITIDEAKIDVDYIGDNDLSKKLEKKFKVKIKSTGNTTADVSGSNSNLIKFLKSDAYLMDNDEIEELFPELMEEVEPEEDEAKLKESEKQKAYQKFFNAALKKFGVDSPGDLDDSKKKEFFNYIDKNYKAKAEEIDAKGKEEEDVNEAMSQKDMEKRLKLIKKAVEKINRQNLRNAKADAMKMMKQSGMFDEDASDEEEVDELTDKQKKLPAGLQKAIKAKEKEEVKERVHYAFDTQKAARTFQNKVDGMPMNIVKVGTGKYYIVDLRPGTKQSDQEKAAKIAVSIGLSESYLEEGTITVKSYAGHEGGGDNPKKLGLKVKTVGSSYGYDDVEISGPDAKLVKFAQNNLGVDSKSRTVKAVQKELDDM